MNEEEKELPIKKIYRQMHQTAESVGLKIITDDWCCKLLAWLYAFGGGNEAVTLNYKLHIDIKAAQRRLNIDGGEIPDAELLPILKSYLKEVNPFFTEPEKEFIQPEWVKEICNYYGLRIR